MSKIIFDEGHAQKILQRMWEQCKTEQFCDVVLIAGTEETRIPAHRAVLCASSDYFQTMFTAPFKESTAREAKVPSVDGEILKSLVEYSYLGRLAIEEDIVEKLLVTAHSLLLETVVNACGKFLAEKLQPSNCLGIGKLAERYQMESLSKKVEEFCLKNFIDLYKNEEFLSLMSAEQLAQLLSNDELHVPYEEDVFKGLMRWLEYDPVERERHKEGLLKLVRLPSIKPTFLFEQVKPVYSSTALLQLYIEAMELHLVPISRQRSAIISAKPRRRNAQFLMAIIKENNKVRLLYHCPQKIKWMKRLEGLEDRVDFGFAVMENDLYIVGGRNSQNSYLNTVFCLNLKTMSTKNVNAMNKCRRYVSVAVLNGFLYAFGGHDGNSHLNSAEKWNPETNTWFEIASMANCRINCAVAILDDKLYAVGGYNFNSTLNSVECYDAQTNAWTSIAPMIERRELPGVAVIKGLLYVMGGVNLKTVECYNPKNDNWTVLCSLSDNTNLRKCTTLNDKIIVLYDDRAEEYNPASNKWQLSDSANGLTNIVLIFSYSGLLLESEFVEN